MTLLRTILLATSLHLAVCCDGPDPVVEETSAAVAPAATPVPVPRWLGSGWSHTCAIAQDGTIRCWGQNTSGQSTPPAGGGFVEVGAGAAHSCTLNKTGAVSFWGANNRL